MGLFFNLIAPAVTGPTAKTIAALAIILLGLAALPRRRQPQNKTEGHE